MSQLGVAQAKTLTVFAKDLGPWQPDIDPRRAKDPCIIDGTNFLDDIDGPRSAFSTNLVDLNYWDTATRGKFNELRIANGMLYGTNTGVWYTDQLSGIDIPLLLMPTNNGKWPWTIAFVGGFYYLAQYDIGLWQYDPVNNTIKHIDTPAGDTIRGVAESFGRLIYLTDTVVAISALDDGTDLTPSLVTAAGAQALSMVPGKALKIESIPDGFLVYFTGGMMKATFTQQQYVFQYAKLTEGIKVQSPNAVVYIPRIGSLCIDASGFSLTREYNYQDYGVPQPWEIVMGDYIRKNIVNYINNNLYGCIDMYFSQDEQKVFISFSSNTEEGLMTTCFAYSLVNKKWGSFDHNHTGMFETFSAINSTYTCSYMGDDGYIRAFSEADFSQGPPDAPATIFDYVFRPSWEELEVQIVNNASDTTFELVTTDIKGSDNNPFWYDNFTRFGTYYINYLPYSDSANDNTSDPAMVISGNNFLVGTYITTDMQGVVEMFAVPLQLPSIGIDSELRVGPFRFSDQVQPDETSAVSTIILGINDADNFAITQDWNILTGSQDWNVIVGQIDWGFSLTVPNVFNTTLRDTNDGVNAPIQGDEPLQIFNNLGSANTYSPLGYSSIFHLLTLDATNPGESFDLKYVELSGLLTGRLLTM